MYMKNQEVSYKVRRKSNWVSMEVTMLSTNMLKEMSDMQTITVKIRWGKEKEGKEREEGKM